MSVGPQAHWLPDGRRLHLNHGPIDLILDAEGPDRDAALLRAERFFQNVLNDLVSELPALRTPLNDANPPLDFTGPVARRMALAAQPHSDVFVTPMAAVAGAVADATLAAMVSGAAHTKADVTMAGLTKAGLTKAYVNNGGDIAFHLAPGAVFRAAGPAGPIEITGHCGVRGLATSGWRGRSHSLGIADAVTVAAPTAAAADVAATLIANAVDLPDHPAIARVAASDHAPDSDLGDRRVTIGVGPLTPDEVRCALDAGVAAARDMRSRGLITQAVLLLDGQTRTVGTMTPLRPAAAANDQKEALTHA